MENYKEISTKILPKLPDELINLCKNIMLANTNLIPHRPSTRLDEKLDDDFSNRLDVPLPIASKQIDNLVPCFFRMHSPPQEFLDWCAKHAPCIDQTRIRLTHIGNGNFLVPHVDLNASYKINFYLDDVYGDNLWHKPKKEYEHLIIDGKYKPDGQYLFSRLDVIESATLQKHKWYAFNASIPHSVINLNKNQSRMFVALGGVSKELFDKV